MTIASWATAFTDNVTVVSASFLNWVRTNLVKAVDGVGGGTYAPSAAIVINGSGLSSDNIGTSTVTGDLTVNGAVDCDTTLNVDGNTTLVGTLEVTGATTVGAVNASGLVTTTGKILLSGTGAGIRHRVNTTEVADAAATIDVDYDVYISAAVPTIGRNITLRHSTAPVPAAGETIKVVNTRTSAASDWIFLREDATELGRITPTALASGRGFIEFVFDGTKWWASACGGAGAISNHS